MYSKDIDKKHGKYKPLIGIVVVPSIWLYELIWMRIWTNEQKIHCFILDGKIDNGKSAKIEEKTRKHSETFHRIVVEMRNRCEKENKQERNERKT